jgi:hypothetical protein
MLLPNEIDNSSFEPQVYHVMFAVQGLYIIIYKIIIDICVGNYQK